MYSPGPLLCACRHMRLPVLLIIFQAVAKYVGGTSVPVERPIPAPVVEATLDDMRGLMHTTVTACPVWHALGAIGRLALDPRGPFADYLAEEYVRPEGRNRDVFPMPSPVLSTDVDLHDVATADEANAMDYIRALIMVLN